MAARPKRVATRSGTGKQTNWADPEIILFAGEEGLPVGAIRQDSLSQIAGSIFGKKTEDVEAEWLKIIGQISALINTEMPSIENFGLDEITFQLGFSAEGHIVFVAKAGITTTISAKFKRKPQPAETHEHAASG